MANPIFVSQYEFYMLVAGWVGFAIFGLLVFLMIKFTPAKTFLNSWMKRTPNVLTINRAGMADFRTSDDKDNTSMTVKGIGFADMTEGSHVFEKKSKNSLYFMFTEYGVTIPKEFPAIIQELRESGYEISNYDDYKKLIDLATNKEFAEKYIEKQKTKEDKKKATDLIEELKKLDIAIKNYKTYKFHDLANMFPNNINPVAVENKVLNEARRQKKRQNLDRLLIYAAVAIFIIGLTAYILIGQLPDLSCPSCVCEIARSAVETVQTNVTQNIQM